MRSLWQRLALEWLGGEGSQALTGETSPGGPHPGSSVEPDPGIYRVRREPAASCDAVSPIEATLRPISAKIE
jgi:hypothetical protein